MRPVQAIWCNIKYNYHPFDFTVDSGLVTGSLLFFIWLYYYIQGHPAYTLTNALASFGASTFIMYWGLVGLNATNKGPQGPTTAIMQLHSLFSIILAAIFLGYIPNI
jgi:hypothetical protein